jgi:hypothetical protein
VVEEQSQIVKDQAGLREQTQLPGGNPAGGKTAGATRRGRKQVLRNEPN